MHLAGSAAGLEGGGVEEDERDGAGGEEAEGTNIYTEKGKTKSLGINVQLLLEIQHLGI